MERELTLDFPIFRTVPHFFWGPSGDNGFDQTPTKSSVIGTLRAFFLQGSYAKFSFLPVGGIVFLLEFKAKAKAGEQRKHNKTKDLSNHFAEVVAYFTLTE